MNQFEFKSMRDGYLDLVQYVRLGEKVEVRGQLTRERRNVLITVEEPWDALPIGQGRRVSTAVGAAEFLQLVAGVQMPKLMVRIAPFFANVLDGEAFHGGYGQRTREALPLVVDRLQRDPETRQAQVSLWDNMRDLYEPAARDVPCTSSLQWFIRRGQLELDVTMRSNDVWLGVPYDFFVFGQLHCTVANVLGASVGRYTHHARSLHLYERDVTAAGGLHKPKLDELVLPRGIGEKGQDWRDVQWEARAILEGRSERDDWWTRTLEAWVR